MMSSSSRPRIRGAIHGPGPNGTAAWEPVALEEALPVAEELDQPMDVADPTQGAGENGMEPEVVGPDPEELQAQLEEAYARGVAEGRAEGEAAEAERLRTVVEGLEKAAKSVEDHRPQWMDTLEKNLVALSTAIAREIIGRELRGQADDIAALVQHAVSELPLEAKVRVRLNPADLSAISSPTRGEALPVGREARWIPDPSVAPGGCLVEGPESLVDGRVEKALERVYVRLIYDD